MGYARRLDAGDVFAGRYRIERHLGEGGMGAVYQAHDTRLDEHVALKTLLLAEHDAEHIERFQREVRLARRITHANVARTHDIGEHGGVHFLTMELIDGSSLDELLEARGHTAKRSGPFDADEAVAICLQIAQGLAAAHAAGVVHRDLKPANVMREGKDTTGRVVITDFGVAHALDNDGKRTSGTLGTPLYMAPEQILGHATTFASDIYSVGIILYELLTGEMPFVGDTPMAVAIARCQTSPMDPREFVDLPAPLVDVVARCLALDPEERPESADDLVTKLRKYTRAASAKTVMVASTPPHSTMGSGSISSPFAPMSPGKRTLAVLPFEFRGPSDLDYLGDSLTQELIDTLSRTRRLRVLGFGATRSLSNKSTDPRVVGEQLGANSIVSGTVQASPTRVVVAVRLTDVASGVQIWSDKFDKRFEDVFEMQDVVSKRVADALRVELNLLHQAWHASAEATELYLRARHLLETKGYMGGADAGALLERAVNLSPNFAPAVAARAVAAVKAWWHDILVRTDTEWHEKAERYVAEALELADDLAETHLAAAVYALQGGDLVRTAAELATALSIAPTLAEAHRYLADLQCEAGRLDEGLRRAKLAVELDPSRPEGRMTVARVHALMGRRDEYDAQLATLTEGEGVHGTALMAMRLRFALWWDDLDSVADVIAHVDASDDPVQQLLAAFNRYARGVGDAAVLDGAFAYTSSFGNARLTSLIGQLVAEAHGKRGNLEGAAHALTIAADRALADVVWLERCPLIADLKGTPAYVAASVKVRNRATTIWELRQSPGSAV